MRAIIINDTDALALLEQLDFTSSKRQAITVVRAKRCRLSNS